MTEPYLILHKVRGEPAFDIAEKLDVEGDEEIWIIPTSGHRAYPYKCWALSELEGDVGQYYFEHVVHELPADWPDHYQTKALKEPSIGAASLLQAIGLAPKINRRF